MNPKNTPAPFKIFLAENDTDDCLFFKEALKEFSMHTELTVVHDGEELMQLLTNETTKLPNVLFLDLNMPRKNGFECLMEIKSTTTLKQLTVIIYSTSFHNKAAAALFNNGASYYISKPFEISKLKKVVQDIIELIAKGDFGQPSIETFLLTEEKRNHNPFSWFSDFFIIPDSTKLY